MVQRSIIVYTSFIGHWIKIKMVPNREDVCSISDSSDYVLSIRRIAMILLLSPGLSHGQDISLRNLKWRRVTI